MDAPCRADAAGAGDGRALDLDTVTLDLAQRQRCALRRQRVATGAQAFAQDDVQVSPIAVGNMSYFLS